MIFWGLPRRPDFPIYKFINYSIIEMTRDTFRF